MKCALLEFAPSLSWISTAGYRAAVKARPILLKDRFSLMLKIPGCVLENGFLTSYGRKYKGR